MVGAWRMMVMHHARDSARGMFSLCVLARRVVRSVPTAGVATRHRDGMRSGRRDGV
jgi:hypothetical protein